MTSPTPTEPAEDLREQIARVIDPTSWRVMDVYLAEMLRKYAGENIGYDPEAFKHKVSLAKADAIMALFSSRLEAVEGERDELLNEADDKNTSADTWFAEHKISEARAQALQDQLDRAVEVMRAFVDEFGGSIDQYHKIGPDWTFKDGTEGFEASTLLNREPIIQEARAFLASIPQEEEKT